VYRPCREQERLIPELADLEASRVVLQTRIRVKYPEAQVNITIQLTEELETILVIARDYAEEGAPIVWNAGPPFPAVPTIVGWINWMATAPV
jgi:hypothetical protein